MNGLRALLLGLLLICMAGCTSTRTTASTLTPVLAAPSATAKVKPTTVPKATPVATPSGLVTVDASVLPREARATLALIAQGGPFPYDRDGVVFQNRERILPKKASGYYHEYTVPTPGESDRGARRIIVGDQGELYYTGDHYQSFVEVIP